MATGALHGRHVRAFIEGSEYTGHIDTTGWARSIETAERRHLGEDRVGRLIGHHGGTIPVNGTMPKAVAASLEGEIRGTDDKLIALVMGDSGRGKIAVIGRDSLSISTPQGDRASVSGTLQCRGGVRGAEVVIAPQMLAAAKADFAAHDRGATAPTSGREIILHAHCTQYGFTGSNNKATLTFWHHTAALRTAGATIAAAQVEFTGTGAARIVNAPTTVNRYISANLTVAGTTTAGITVVVLVAVRKKTN